MADDLKGLTLMSESIESVLEDAESDMSMLIHMFTEFPFRRHHAKAEERLRDLVLLAEGVDKLLRFHLRNWKTELERSSEIVF
jgi:hypothetical protein